MKKRLLIIINGWTTEISGGDFHAMEIGRCWGLEHDVDFMIPTSALAFQKDFFQNLNALVIRTPFESPQLLQRRVGVILAYISRMFLGAIQPAKSWDAIIASSHFLVDLVPAVALKLRSGAPLTVLVHGFRQRLPHTRDQKLSLIAQWISWKLIRRYADRVGAISEQVRDYLMTVAKVLPPRLRPVTNGVDLEAFERVTASHCEFAACYMGRLIREKGIYDLLESWEIVLQHKPGAKLLIIGGGPDSQKLREAVSQRGLLEQIKFAGPQFGENKIRLMKSALTFLFPSYRETWSIVIAEAVAAGLPVICYPLPVIESLWDRAVACAADRNPRGLAAKLLEVLDSPELYASLQVAGRAKVADLDWRAVARRELDTIAFREQ